MQRHKTDRPSVPYSPFSIQHTESEGWGPTNHEYGEIQKQEAPFPRKEVWDDAPWSKPHMQDAMLQKITDFSFTGSEYPGAEFGSRAVTTTGIHKLVNLPSDHIVAVALNDRVFKHPGASVYDLYGRLAFPFTREVEISENPFDTEFSIWFLLVDLVELPRLAKSLLEARKLLTEIGRRSNTTTLKEVAGTHLAIQFGLLPTLADLKDFFKIFITWGLRYSKMNEAFNHGFSHHEPIKAVIPGFEYEVSSSFTDLGTHIDVKAQVRMSNCILHHTTNFYFVCPQLTGILSRIKQFVDGWGVLDPLAIWDVIPFSFVVDWFFDVGPWIHKNLKPHLFPADIIISDYGESLGRTCSVRTFGSYTHNARPWWQLDEAVGWEPQSVVDSPLCSYELSQYVRRRQFPRKLGIRTPSIKLQGSIVTLRRFFIGTALVTQAGITRYERRASAYRRNHPRR